MVTQNQDAFGIRLRLDQDLNIIQRELLKDLKNSRISTSSRVTYVLRPCCFSRGLQLSQTLCSKFHVYWSWATISKFHHSFKKLHLIVQPSMKALHASNPWPTWVWTTEGKFSKWYHYFYLFKCLVSLPWWFECIQPKI